MKTPNQQQHANVVIPSNPADRKKVNDAITEISNSLTMIESQRDNINQTLANLDEQFGLPAKYMRKVAKIYHKQNLVDVVSEFDEVESIYTVICQGGN